MKILLCDGDYKNALGITRALGRNGHTVDVLAHRRGSLCSYSRHCHDEFIIPPYEDSDFEEALFKIIEATGCELIIPVGTPAHRRLSVLKEKILTRTRIVIADAGQIAFCMDKEKTCRYADSIGVPIPRTYYLKNKNEISAIAAEISIPCVIKGRFETGFNMIAYADDQKELLDRFSALCRKHKLDNDSLPLVQEYIEGEGYGFFAVYNNGHCGPTFQHRRLREYPPTGGMSVCSESTVNQQVFAYGKKLLDSLQWHGPAMVEFKTNREGTPVLMEVNPKFWGSLDLGIEAGVDFPQALVDIAENREIALKAEYKYPFKYHWPLHGDLLHALMRPYKIPAFIFDCLNPRVKSNLWTRDDLAGTIGICRTITAKAMRRLLRIGG